MYLLENFCICNTSYVYKLGIICCNLCMIGGLPPCIQSCQSEYFLKSNKTFAVKSLCIDFLSSEPLPLAGIIESLNTFILQKIKKKKKIKKEYKV